MRGGGGLSWRCQSQHPHARGCHSAWACIMMATSRRRRIACMPRSHTRSSPPVSSCPLFHPSPPGAAGCARPKSAMRRSASGEERESSRFWGLRSRCSGGVKRGLGRGWSRLTRLPHLPSRAVGWQHPRRTDSGRGGPLHAQPARQWQHLEPSKHPTRASPSHGQVVRPHLPPRRQLAEEVARRRLRQHLPWRRNWDRSPPAQNSITRYSRLRVCLEVGIRGVRGWASCRLKERAVGTPSCPGRSKPLGWPC